MQCTVDNWFVDFWETGWIPGEASCLFSCHSNFADVSFLLFGMIGHIIFLVNIIFSCVACNYIRKFRRRFYNFTEFYASFSIHLIIITMIVMIVDSQRTWNLDDDNLWKESMTEGFLDGMKANGHQG